MASDSHESAKFLDETYPDTPRAHVLVPNLRNHIYQDGFGIDLHTPYGHNLRDTEFSRESFIESRLKMFRETHWEDMAPEEKAQQMWAVFKNDFGVVDGWYQKSGRRWIMGDIFSFADIYARYFNF
ncbi:hypothetical protein EDB19DRAFT_1749036 [Suillus lakei]|nr:hypothetical protein EDB19DRAFT_1749036 [Suillus lakei]